MTKSGQVLAVATAVFACTLGGADAASLQVSPVLLEVPAPGAATTMTLRNTGDSPIMSQVRVFRWTQSNGQETLELTDEVVASPPTVELRPKQDYTVRVVRITKRPYTGEESYRVVVDELPDLRRRSGTVAIVLRHSVPLFFVGPQASTAAPQYSVRSTRGGLVLRVTNEGDRRIQLSAITIRNSAGRQVAFGPGLVGYALGHSTMQWTARSSIDLGAAAGLTINGNSETGKISARATPIAAP